MNNGANKTHPQFPDRVRSLLNKLNLFFFMMVANNLLKAGCVFVIELFPSLGLLLGTSYFQKVIFRTK